LKGGPAQTMQAILAIVVAIATAVFVQAAVAAAHMYVRRRTDSLGDDSAGIIRCKQLKVAMFQLVFLGATLWGVVLMSEGLNHSAAFTGLGLSLGLEMLAALGLLIDLHDKETRSGRVAWV
jgi:hypothetical protein